MIAACSPTLKITAITALAAALTACTGAYDGPYTDTRGAAELARQLAGKVAGPPLHCLSRHSTNDQQVIDRDTILYRDGRTVYVQNTQGSCYPNGSGFGYALVLRKYGTTDTCRGDIAQVISTSGGTFAGSCSFGDFIPYRPARSSR